ncbi:hypothetical protein YC2023_050100 [Brassica napus]
MLSSLDRSVVTRRRAFSRSRSTRSAQLFGSISRGHSLVLFTLRSSISRSSSDLPLLVELTHLARSLAVTHSLSSLDRRVVTRPFCLHSSDESSLDQRVVTRPTSRHSTDESSLDRRVLTRQSSHHSIDESSLDRRVLTRPTSPHSTDESSLDRRVLTRPTSPHSTDESSLDRFVITLPFCRHSAQSVLSQSVDSICVVAWLDLSRSLARSLYSAQIDLSRSLRSLSPRGVDVSIQQEGLAESYPYLTYTSWLHDESSQKQLARALAVTRLDLSWSLGADRSRAVTWLDLSRALTRSPYSVQNDLSQSLRSLSPRGVDVSFCRHPIDESSLDRRVLTRPTSPHSTDESSLDRRVVTRLRIAWLDLSRSLDSLPFGHSTLSLAVTRLSPLRSLDLFFAVTRLSLSQSLGSDRSLAVTQIARKSRA